MLALPATQNYSLRLAVTAGCPERNGNRHPHGSTRDRLTRRSRRANPILARCATSSVLSGASRNYSRMKLTTPSIQRPIFAVLAVVATCLMVTLVVRGSEPADSGWTVFAADSPFSTRNTPTTPQIRIAINHVLEQSQSPLLLQAPAQQRAEERSRRRSAGRRCAGQTSANCVRHLRHQRRRLAAGPPPHQVTAQATSNRKRQRHHPTAGDSVPRASSSSPSDAPTETESTTTPAPEEIPHRSADC